MSNSENGSKKEIAIRVDALHKSFRLPTEKSSGIKQSLVNFAKGVKGYKEQKVLRGVSFEVEKGDFFGVVGRNGSGKSTLLKLLAGIYQPTRGFVTVHGSLVPFIELGVGFNPELTGRENVYMNGALLGFSNEEIDKMYGEIVDFAELHDFMDQKLKNYSSGMQVRLAFSIAVRAESEILVLDEVLAVGDEAFQRKCNAYFAELKKSKKTVILVTHNMDAVQQFCNKAILIQDGKITYSGSTTKVAQRYRELNMPIESKRGNKQMETNTNIEDVALRALYMKADDKLSFDIEILSRIIIDDPVVTFELIRNTGEVVYRWVSDEKCKGTIDLNRPNNLHLEIENIFPDGIFESRIGIKKRDRSKTYALFNGTISFEIVNKGSYPGDIFWKPKEHYSYDVAPKKA
jgi:ABC-2 type transport system ATP-binding protein